MHFFAHDQKFAYDSLGKHPLPYLGINQQFDVCALNQDPQDWGIPEDEAGPDGPEPMMEMAWEHIQEQSFGLPE